MGYTWQNFKLMRLNFAYRKVKYNGNRIDSNKGVLRVVLRF